MVTDPQMKKENAKEFARCVIEDDFGQKVDDETLESVAMKVLKAIPAIQKETQPAILVIGQSPKADIAPVPVLTEPHVSPAAP